MHNIDANSLTMKEMKILVNKDWPKLESLDIGKDC